MKALESFAVAWMISTGACACLYGLSVGCSTPPPSSAKLRADQVRCLVGRNDELLRCVDPSKPPAAQDACIDAVATDCHSPNVSDGGSHD